ncbi:MAG: phosphatase PAP2 family protein [Candidatus Bathyarchaeota archaeon]|nr:phosphatase PAP2 family protein [Candidatus Bathyarchaeota archaeon]
MKLYAGFQGIIEKTFFKGKANKKSVYLTYVIANVILMVLLFFLLLNTYAYDWTGQLYPEGSGFRLQTGLDTAIPFVPQMVIFYVYLFYPLVILTMLYFAFVDYRKGYALGWSLVAINAISVLIYIVFPVSTFWYRQELLTHPLVGNVWATQVYDIFTTDTSFNCFPSLHAAVSTICFFAWFQYAKLKPNNISKIAAAAAFIVAAGVVLSTLFIKQHYIVDEVAGVALAWGVGTLVFKKLYKPPSETLGSNFN